MLRITFPENNEALLNSKNLEAINIFKRGTTNAGLRQHLLLNPAITLEALEAASAVYEEAENEVASRYYHEPNNASVLAITQNNRVTSYPSNSQRQTYAQPPPIIQPVYNYQPYPQMQNYGYPLSRPQLGYKFHPIQQKPGYAYPTKVYDQNTQHRNQQKQNDPRQINTNRNNPPKCYTCGNTGHYSHNCALPPKCYTCGNIGHYSKNCALRTKMCTKSRAWDHTADFCPQGNINNNEIGALSNVYCDNCGARGESMSNAT